MLGSCTVPLLPHLLHLLNFKIGLFFFFFRIDPFFFFLAVLGIHCGMWAQYLHGEGLVAPWQVGS